MKTLQQMRERAAFKAATTTSEPHREFWLATLAQISDISQHEGATEQEAEA